MHAAATSSRVFFYSTATMMIDRLCKYWMIAVFVTTMILDKKKLLLSVSEQFSQRTLFAQELWLFTYMSCP